MKFNIKSRKGFTLIELLVVIGILAVLAAIAIPSVAGLIDRANVSADKTNSNEMTNAIERFASEYELYCQDIASGAIVDANNDGKPDDLDSAQGRVYNVTGAMSRNDIANIEKAQTTKAEDVGDEIAIYRDTKYPVNNATLHKIIENYMKTSSSTFEPKQSDCNYYYSPDCGIVVCARTDKSNTSDLNELVISGMDAKGNKLGSETQWINITSNTSPSSSLNQSGTIPSGGKYYTGMGIALDYLNSTPTYTAGDAFPEPAVGDVYVYNNLIYMYGAEIYPDLSNSAYKQYNGWGVAPTMPSGPEREVFNESVTILESINNEKVVCANYMFYNCFNFNTSIKFPETIENMYATFSYATSTPQVSVPCHISETDINSWNEFGGTVTKYHYDGCGH